MAYFRKIIISYYLDSIDRKFQQDTSAKAARRDAVLWSKTDLMLTDAFMHIVKDIKLGRLPDDSISQRKDSVLTDEFYMQQFQRGDKRISLTRLTFTGTTTPGLSSFERGYKKFS